MNGKVGEEIRIWPFCFWNKSSEFGKNKFHYFPAKYYTYIFSPAPHPTPRYGYNNWRDPQKPSQILTKLCQHYKLDGPHFSAGKVRIGELTYCGEQFIDDEGGNGKCYLFLNDQLTLVTINIYRVSRKKRKHFFFHQINIVFCKEWYQDHWNWLSSFYSMVISQNIVITNFLFILVIFLSGIMAFFTSIHCCPEACWSVQTKQRENLWTAIPAINNSPRLNKIRKLLCFKKWLENQYYWTKSNDLGIILFRIQCFNAMKS